MRSHDEPLLIDDSTNRISVVSAAPPQWSCHLLPVHIVFHNVLSFLSPQSVIPMNQVCQAWREEASSHQSYECWKKLTLKACKSSFGLSAAIHNPFRVEHREMSWKEKYYSGLRNKKVDTQTYKMDRRLLMMCLLFIV
eukprot:PhF_6_TR22011/c0_g1_i1/m.31275